MEALQFYKDNEITVIDWPPYSLDLNPTENVCAFINLMIRSNKYFKKYQLNSKFFTIWEEISDDQIRIYSTSIYIIELENESITIVI